MHTQDKKFEWGCGVLHLPQNFDRIFLSNKLIEFLTEPALYSAGKN